MATKVGYLKDKNNAILEPNSLGRHFICVYQPENTKINKTGTYGFTYLPVSRVKFTSNTVFSLQDNKIYYNGEKPAIIQVNINTSIGLSLDSNHYLLCGGVNGGYNLNAAFSVNGIAGKSANASFLLAISKGQFISILVGSPGVISDATVYDTNVSAFVVSTQETEGDYGKGY